MTGFSNAQSGLNGLQGAHFTDQHDIGIFAQSGAQGTGEALHVLVNFTLVNQAVLVRVHELDGVFNGDDVLVAFAIDLIQHGGQRGGLAGAGGSGNQDQAARTVAQLRHHEGEIELGEALNLKRNDAENRGDGSALVEDVGAKA